MLIPKMKLTLSSILLMTALSILGPSLIFAALLIHQLDLNDRTELQNKTIRDAGALALDIDATISNMSSILRLVSTSPELKNGELRNFHSRTQVALMNFDTFVIVVDQTGQQLLNTRVPFEERLEKTSNLPALQKSLSSNQEVLSDVFVGRTSGNYVFNLIQPLPAGFGAGARAVIATRNANELKNSFSQVSLPNKWSAIVLDASGKIATSSNPDEYPAGIRSLIAGDLDGRIGVERMNSGVMLIGDGTKIGAYARIGLTGWTVVILGPSKTAQKVYLETWRMLLWGGAGLFVLSFAFVGWLGRQLTKSVNAISEMAQEVGKGNVVSPSLSTIRELDFVAKSLSEASFDRSEAELKHKVVSREIVHRTKNLMSVMASMVRQLGKSSNSVADFQVRLEKRIQSLAQSIDLLTDSNWMGVTIHDLVWKQMSIFAVAREKIIIQGKDFLLFPEAVQALGMIFHELGTNAVKYGALSVPQGKLRIVWDIVEREGEAQRIHLAWVESDGPAVVEPAQTGGFGSIILGRHAEATFDGVVTLSYHEHGLQWKLDAPFARLSNSNTEVTKLQIH